MLDNLPDTLRLPVVLYYLDGLTVAETAQALGVPVGTVKFRLHQARKKLRVELDARRERGKRAMTERELRRSCNPPTEPCRTQPAPPLMHSRRTTEWKRAIPSG